MRSTCACNNTTGSSRVRNCPTIHLSAGVLRAKRSHIVFKHVHPQKSRYTQQWSCSCCCCNSGLKVIAPILGCPEKAISAFQSAQQKVGCLATVDCLSSATPVAGLTSISACQQSNRHNSKARSGLCLAFSTQSQRSQSPLLLTQNGVC